MLCPVNSLRRFSSEHWNFLERTTVQPVPIFQVKRDAGGSLSRSDLGFESDQFDGIYIFHGHAVQLCAVFVVDVRHQTSGEEDSKGAGKLDPATLQTSSVQRAYHDTGIGRTVKFASHAGREPFRL